MSIVSNADTLAKAWERRAKALEGCIRKATTQATKVVFAESKKQMQKLIYDKPVPTRVEAQLARRSVREKSGKKFSARAIMITKTGRASARGKKKLWTRTGSLVRSERFRIVSAYEGWIENKASRRGKGGNRGYAAYRHRMKNTRYPAPWRTRALQAKSGEVRGIYRDAIRDSMRAGIIPRIK